MRKLLVTDGLSSEGRAILEEQTQLFELKFFEKISTAELEREISDAEAILIRTATKINRQLLTHAKKLKLIVRAGVGVDHIDLKAAQEFQISVSNTPQESADTVAEFTIGMILAAARKIPLAKDALLKGDWSRKPLQGLELKSKTLGILGLGRIGSRVASRMKAFEMNIIACDPYLPKKEAEIKNIPLVDLETLLKRSDILSIHTPLTDETRNLFNADRLSQLKPDALLVNCARGGIVVEKNILQALDRGHLYAYAADVFENEPVDLKHPLLQHPRAVLSPHIGAQTIEAQIKVGIAAAQQIVQYFKSGQVQNRVTSYD